MSNDDSRTPEELEAAERAENERAFLGICKQERERAKSAMLARNTKRVDALTAAGELREGETLEEYDTRIAQAPSDVRQ